MAEDQKTLEPKMPILRFEPDGFLYKDLVAFWLRFRANTEFWKRGMEEEEGSGLGFPPRLVAYDLIPIFRNWAIRTSQAVADREDLVPNFLATICPDKG